MPRMTRERDRSLPPRRLPGGARSVLVAAALATGLAAGASGNEPIPSPESHLGFRPGADYRLAAWGDVTSYFGKVDRASDRVLVRALGETTEGRPYVVAFVSSPETIRDLERYRTFQEMLADPRKLPNTETERKAIAAGKPVVAITCSIHSSETASTLMAMELVHGLASGVDPQTREILDGTILMLVPSANPDGVDKVARWYERSKGHPWEGSGMPELYHKYAGHDTNRDWFMLNLKETRLLSRLLYTEWFPTLLYDVHQMGSRGARIFVPPFYDPVNPNLDPRLSQGIFLIGAHMANDLAAAGKKGVLYGAQYDNWWNGGNRTTPQRHNIIAVLTEAASVKMATPVFLDKEDLKGGARGFPDHRRAVNFVDPWPGGWWRLRDIVDDELICARSLLTLAARYRESFQTNLVAMARDAIRGGTDAPPYGWVVPREQRDPGEAAALVRVLHDSGVEVRRSLEPFDVSGVRFPAGTWVFPAAQPYRAHLKDMMERQVYPTRLSAGGKAETPYDVTGWTLPLQMGVRVVEANEPLRVKTEKVDRVAAPAGEIDRDDVSGEPAFYSIEETANDDFIVLNALQAAGVNVARVVAGDRERLEGADLSLGEVVVPAGAKTRAVFDQWLPRVSTRVEAHGAPEERNAAADRSHGSPGLASPTAVPHAGVRTDPIRPVRVAVYQPWVPSIDEGWTRLVLETFKFPYTTVHNAEVRSGAIRSFDVLLIPSVETKTLKDGYGADETEPAYVGGLGPEGEAEIRRFVREGGRLVCLDASCDYAIETLNLPVKDVLKGLPTSVFYGPGSILRASVSGGHELTRGVPEEVFVYFDGSRAFELTGEGQGQVVVSYARSGPLESGWLLGPAKLQGKAALVNIPFGRGSVVLFGFPPQHRGQTHGTYRLLFNALVD